MPWVVLVTGSRHWEDRKAICDALRPYRRVHGVSPLLIEGGCLTGADSIANSVVQREIKNERWERKCFEAHWAIWGKAAGPKRNDLMLYVLQGYHGLGYRCMVHAFPLGESPGTRGMIRLVQRKAPSVGLIVHEGSESA